MMKIAVLCVLLAVWLQLPIEGDAVCCKTHNFLFEAGAKKVKVCDDCTKGTPYCSLYGSCNVFGCNCDGGCRYGECSGTELFKAPPPPPPQTKPSYGGGGYYKREVEDGGALTGEDVISAADQDGDGRMSLEEARMYLGLSSDRVRRSFADMDRDFDEFLSADEIDPTF